MNLKTSTALAVLLLGALSFFDLFGIEKAIVAILLGSAYLNESRGSSDKYKYPVCAGIGLGIISILILTVIMISKSPKW
ncbi:MAG: hypothetical protein A2452_12355 [Candidatus Firestonebacteria bacterium RIFOXYC2_FULL_39_67]|nr:MAG: hypothetical protein A2536_07885 [Candidatus Firestonebacteria bacterium RIFOXYD2_FULL_39_29]OGF55639.1 MAG: hypothetical protein A2452_12355 [Candidatus Firestonebacteria bacterium RIFOXYC2_FULL_39_67]OGF57562.1 MAG: hypothetical protein A2497_01315 [Candidatus Firestonebacteria bacterium RifOxyC12_full_39_7]